MALKNSWFSKYANLNYTHREESIEFNEVLKKENLEIETVPIQHYEFPFENNERGDVNRHNLYIDKPIYEKVKLILANANIENWQNDICSILKQHYYKKILLITNKEGVEKRIIFYKEFYELYSIIKSNEVEEIKFSTNKKGEDCVVKSNDLINVILSCYKRIVLKDDFSAQIITNVEENLTFEKLEMDNVINSALFSLVYYIQTNTNYAANKSEEDVLNKKFSNSLLKLIYDLLDAAQLLNINSFISEPKDFLRNRLKRYINKTPHLLNYFNTNKVADIFDIDMVFGNLDYWQKVIDNHERLKKI